MTQLSRSKIAMVTTLMPETHYSRYLLESLLHDDQHILTICIYANKEDNIAPLEEEATIKQCWSQTYLYPLQIVWQVLRDKIDLVHLQHELNMYGGPVKATLFPTLVLLLRLLRKRVIVTIHAVPPIREIDSSFLKTFSWRENRILVIIVRLVLFYIFTSICRFSSCVIVHTHHIKSVLNSDYKSSQQKIVVIPHGIPLQKSIEVMKRGAAKWWNAIGNKSVILYFGYIVKRKGLEDLIHAFQQISKKYPEYVLVIAGGSLRGQEMYADYLRRLANELDLVNRIVFTSFVSEDELGQLLSTCEFVVLPASYSISASGPLAQALSFNKPVITADLGSLKEEVITGKDGLLYTPKNVDSLEQAMEKFIKDDALIQEMSANIKTKAQERSWPNIASKTMAVYSKTLES